MSHWPPTKVEVHADGTAHDGNGKFAKWTFQPSSNQERHYTFVWDHEFNVDSIVLSTDGKTISGKVNGKAPIKAERIGLPSSDPNSSPNYFGTK